MDTLKEIEYYCKEPNPAGALLLTGQWGCGKTYFVKNQVSKELAYTHIFLHISLFGMASTAAGGARPREERINKI